MTTDKQRILREIEAQRRTIIEHMQKYEAALRQGNQGLASFQLGTISRAQEVIRREKARAGFHIPDDGADYWRP